MIFRSIANCAVDMSDVSALSPALTRHISHVLMLLTRKVSTNQWRLPYALTNFGMVNGFYKTVRMGQEPCHFKSAFFYLEPNIIAY